MFRLIRYLYYKVVAAARLILYFLDYIIYTITHLFKKKGRYGGMKTGNKNIQKSIRISQDTYDFLMTFEGEGFNQKLETACAYFAQNKHRLDIQIDSANSELKSIRSDIYRLSHLHDHINRIDMYMRYIDDIIASDIPDLPINEVR